MQSPTYHFYAVMWLVLSLLLQIVQSKDIWSRWFDEKPTLLGDNQTLLRIRKVFGYSCPFQHIVGVQCRVVNSDDPFHHRNWYQGNHLSPPCDVTGVSCSAIDQLMEFPSLPCRDYEIRFMCREKDSTATAELQNPLSVHGGFIALAAGLSVVVPLICVLIVQLRRAKREELNRVTRGNGAAADGNESCGESGVAQPPPTYEELFGPDEESRVRVVHSRYRSTDNILVNQNDRVNFPQGDDELMGVVNEAHQIEADCGDGGGGGGGEGGGGGGGGGGSRLEIERQDINRNHPNFFTVEEGGESSIATISGNDVRDASVNPNNTHSSRSRSENDSRPDRSTTESVDVGDLGNGSNHISNNSDLVGSCSVSGSDVSRARPPPVYSSTSNSSMNRPFCAISSETQPPPSYYSPQPIIRQVALTTPSSSSSSTSSSTSETPSSSTTSSHRTSTTSISSTTSPTNQNPPNTNLPSTSSDPVVRLPGMHISIQDFLSLFREQTERELPPPSYEEALKILEKAEKDKLKLKVSK